ncbi:MAG: glycosyltransferase family 2 protein [Oscillospiraceae bacterium]|nr:glycosyltransferase family 2 protein [Oscillospiraceae bacterium]
MPTISVIVPVYKVEPYLHRCVDSILNQTFTDLEVILVDDGSPDHCGAICDEYAGKDSRVRVIHKENGGLSSARNAGIDAMTGRFGMFVDSDDWIHPQMLELLFRAQEEYGTAMVSVTNQWTSENQVKYVQYEYAEVVKTVYATKTIEEALYSFVFGKKRKDVLTCGLYSIWKTDVFKDLRFDECVYYAEDLDMLCKITPHLSDIVHMHIPLYFYYTGSESLNRCPLNKKKFCELSVLRNAASLAHISETEKQKFMYRYLFKFLSLAWAIEKEKNLQLQKEFAPYEKRILCDISKLLRTPYVTLYEILALLLYLAKCPLWKIMYGKTEMGMVTTLNSLA